MNISYWLTPQRLFGLFAMVVVFLNVTNLYTLVSGLTGIPFKLIGIGMLGVLSFYVLVNLRSLSILLQHKPFLWFLFFFVALPAISVLYSPYIMLRFIGYYALSGLIFLSCIIWIKQEGWQNFCKLVLISWGIGVAAITLSVIVPEFFAPIAMMQAEAEGGLDFLQELEVSSAKHSRGFGLYMQPNRAWSALMFHVLILTLVYFYDKRFLRFVVLGFSGFAILLTGSRGGFVMFFIFTGLLIINEFLSGVRENGKLKTGASTLPQYIALGLIGLIAFIGANYVASATGDAELTPIERIISSFTTEVDLGEDASVLGRLQAQLIYLDLIKEKPIFGYGAAASTYMRYMGALPNVSHNNILEIAFIMGIPATIACYSFFIYLSLTRKAKYFNHYFRYKFPLITTVFLFISSFTISTLFTYRIFPMLIAFWLMMLFFPTDSKAETARRSSNYKPF